MKGNTPELRCLVMPLSVQHTLNTNKMVQRDFAPKISNTDSRRPDSKRNTMQVCIAVIRVYANDHPPRSLL